MKKRWIQAGGAAVIMAVSIPFSAFAGEWKQNDRGWWWQNDDATWPASTWMWLDGNKDGVAECYYFDLDGYMLVNTETPDHYQVDVNGAWVVNGVVQTQSAVQNQNPNQGQNQTAGQAENKSGQQAPANGWNQEEYGVWRYYVNSRMVTEDWRKVDGKRYYFDSEGIMLTGFQEIDGATYYFDSQGALNKKSFNLDGMHYEVDSTGEIIDEMDLEDWKYQKKYKTDSGSQGNSGTTGNSGSQSSGNGSSEVDMSDYANRVFEIVNEEREAAGKSALEWDDTLGECAAVRAEELVEKYSHTRPDGASCFTILDEYGVKYMTSGENIAMGQKTPEKVMNAWMNSSGHKANILKDKYEKIGVGFYYDGNYYWVQMFSD